MHTSVVFSEPVESGDGPGGAENRGNYVFSPELEVLSAELQEDDRTVVLRTGATDPEEIYQLTVGSVNDRAATPNASVPQDLWVQFTVIARINFQPATTPVPFGWSASSGELFGLRSNGMRFGWLSAPGSSRTRGSSRSPDVQHDSLTHTHDAMWEIELPDGNYDVRLVAGDPSHTDSYYSFLVEGESIVSGSPTSSNRWIEGRRVVTVTEGRLTVSSGPGADNNKICFIEISVAL